METIVPANEIKNTIAKMVIVIWIILLVNFALSIAKYSISFDVNNVFQLPPEKAFSVEIVREGKLILLMLAIGILGGVSFMIKDFYKSIKFSNMYATFYSDYRGGNISRAEFQRLVTIEVYTGRFNYTWMFWFLIQPVLSSILGVIAFFIARSGLGVLQGTTTTMTVSIQSVYLYAVLTYLAGFSSHKFIAWLDRLADKIFSTTLPEKKEEVKNEIITTTEGDTEKLKREVNSLSSLKNSDTLTESSIISEEHSKELVGTLKKEKKSKKISHSNEGEVPMKTVR